MQKKDLCATCTREPILTVLAMWLLQIPRTIKSIPNIYHIKFLCWLPHNAILIVTLSEKMFLDMRCNTETWPIKLAWIIQVSGRHILYDRPLTAIAIYILIKKWHFSSEASRSHELCTILWPSLYFVYTNFKGKKKPSSIDK